MGRTMQTAIRADDHDLPFLGPTWPKMLGIACFLTALVAWAYSDDDTLLFWLVRRGQMEALARDAWTCDAVLSLSTAHFGAEQSREANGTRADGLSAGQGNSASFLQVGIMDQYLARHGLSRQACRQLVNRAEEMGLISFVVLHETDSVLFFRTRPSRLVDSPGVSYIYENQAGKGGLPAHSSRPLTRLSSQWMQFEYQRF